MEGMNITPYNNSNSGSTRSELPPQGTEAEQTHIDQPVNFSPTTALAAELSRLNELKRQRETKGSINPPREEMIDLLKPFGYGPDDVDDLRRLAHIDDDSTTSNQ